MLIDGGVMLDVSLRPSALRMSPMLMPEELSPRPRSPKMLPSVIDGTLRVMSPLVLAIPRSLRMVLIGMDSDGGVKFALVLMPRSLRMLLSARLVLPSPAWLRNVESEMWVIPRFTVGLPTNWVINVTALKV